MTTKFEVLILRLIKDDKIVGYEKHENGSISHLPIHILNKINYKTPERRNYDVDDSLMWNNVFIPDKYDPEYSRIPHNRIDMPVGIRVKNKRLFQRDRLQIDGIKRAFTVQYHAPAAMWVVIPDMVFINGEPKKEALVNYIESGVLNGEIIGVEGVKNDDKA